MKVKDWRALHSQITAMKPEPGSAEKLERAYYTATGDLERALRKDYGGTGMDQLLRNMQPEDDVSPEAEKALMEFREKVMRLKYLG